MNWDRYFLNVCNVVATNSKCFSRKIGAIIVKDKSIISTGYNGPPRGIPPCDSRWGEDESLSLYIDIMQKKKASLSNRCPRQAFGFKSGEGLDLCVAGHAERNALINAARHGIPTHNTIMYMNCAVPCKDCLIEIINAGVREVVVIDQNTYYDTVSKYLLKTSKLCLREYHLGE